MKCLELNQVMVICNHTIINHMIIGARLIAEDHGERNYEDLKKKSNSSTKSTEQQFPDEIANWVGFEQEDIWTASDINIFDALTPLDQSILFLDGRVLKDMIRQPDFVVVNGNMLLLMAWKCKPKWVLYGVLSIYDQMWFLKRKVYRVEEENYGLLSISGFIKNTSTDPTLLRSIVYIINLASNDRYTPFLKKPTMIC
ncbi:hypothetical protein GLOIN_2v1788144 [Rhizophagus irregularis DAOM 181602=DAOM 197198]|nr:hypothetical protein GLOIN_2v1788144 [Rhizophagus irregularis DAOM 181602=DAOM 197198]